MFYMKTMIRLSTLAALFLLPTLAFSQKDSVKLICPLNDATVVPPPTNQMHWDQPDLCVVLVSLPDSVVKAVGAGRITNTEFTDEAGNGIVLFSRINGKDYYFWYTGLTKLLVRRNDAVKAGQAIGYVSPGQRIELTMYQFETPVDPMQYLSCPRVLRGF
jgi:hypothetical protein